MVQCGNCLNMWLEVRACFPRVCASVCRTRVRFDKFDNPLICATGRLIEARALQSAEIQQKWWTEHEVQTPENAIATLIPRLVRADTDGDCYENGSVLNKLRGGPYRVHNDSAALKIVAERVSVLASDLLASDWRLQCNTHKTYSAAALLVDAQV